MIHWTGWVLNIVMSRLWLCRGVAKPHTVLRAWDIGTADSLKAQVRARMGAPGRADAAGLRQEEKCLSWMPVQLQGISVTTRSHWRWFVCSRTCF